MRRGMGQPRPESGKGERPGADAAAPRRRISVVVPVLDERRELERTIRLARAPLVEEVVVVDGGSRDGSAELAARLADRVLRRPPGRARQMNAGAEVARGDVLLFLHADTHLPAGWDRAVAAAIDSGAIGGRFDVEIRGGHPLLPMIAHSMNLRSRLTGVSTGDQAIFASRRVFEALGGFPEVPLMEDVAFSAALRRAGRVACLRERVATSGRRWERDGVVRTVALMWALRLAYALGVPPARLARWYGPGGRGE